MSDWLVTFARVPRIEAACKAAGVTKTSVYEARDSHPSFKAAWLSVRDDWADRLETKAITLALEGNPLMLIFLLKNLKPEVYSDRLELRHMGEVEHRLELVDGREPRELDSRRRREAARLLLEGSSDGALEALEVETTAGGDITSGVLDGPGPSE
jgi:hypothetical protein